MKIVRTFPRRVHEIENVWIPMADGCRLAARIWLPQGAEDSPVPAVVEYIPYRKRDATRFRDEPMHAYFAGHGYAAVRIDLRGSGDSDGLLLDEYLPQEQEDGLAAIAWIAAQPWCSGAVGMMGKSWGGFNALQIAARRPPALKAIITVCSTDDRYTDDAHYMGGCVLNENLIWGSVLMTISAQPPDPQLVGPRWRDMWEQRLQHVVPFPDRWLRHQHRDAYWRHGSVGEDLSRITCPVYAIGGWADGYTNAVPRLLAGLRVPRKGLVGPWAHVYPHEGVPGPAIGFLQEALRWWDRWLAGIDDGIMDEPMYRVWMQDGGGWSPTARDQPGRWVAEHAWPSPRIEQRECGLDATRGTLMVGARAPAAQPEARVRSPQSVGVHAGGWCGFGVEGEQPDAQNEDDARSLVFETPPLDGRLEILGAPVLRLRCHADRPVAIVAARLNDVAPDGTSRRVTYGLLNLTHRAGHERPVPIEPGRAMDIEIRLNDAAHGFPAGHRLRLALSTSYWPIAWPAPEPVELSIVPDESLLRLPVRPPDPADAELPPFGPAEGAPPPPHDDLHPGGLERRLERDDATGRCTYTVAVDVTETGAPARSHLHPIDLEVGHGVVERFVIDDDDPGSAGAAIEQRIALRRPGWSIRIATTARCRSDRDAFHIEAELRAFEEERLVFERRWASTVPRRLV